MTELIERLTANLPAQMKQAKRWLVWKEEPSPDPAKKPRKVPYYLSGHTRGKTDTPEDTANLGTFEDMLTALKTEKYAGAAFALGHDGTGKHWQGIDLDDVTEKNLGDLVDDLPSYTETSPSGEGWHSIGYGPEFENHADNNAGIEFYSRARYFTVTGNGVAGAELCDISNFVKTRLWPRCAWTGEPTKSRTADSDDIGTDFVLDDEWERAKDALFHIKDFDNYQPWLNIGMALHSTGREEALNLWDEWSKQSKHYDLDEIKSKWRSFGKGFRAPITIGTLFKMAQDAGWVTKQVITKGPGLVKVSIADVITNPSPKPTYVWEGFIPHGVVTLLGAHGGVGKSTIALMLATYVANGDPFLGKDTEQCPVVFASLEDAGNIVRYRLKTICENSMTDPHELEERLYVVDGSSNPELYVAETRSGGMLTSVYVELRELVQSTGAKLLVVDNASDAFGGDEIQRRQVRAFIRALAEIASDTGAAVLLLAHVDKMTSKNRKAEGGEGYSGSTAWHNSVRSRLFMTRNEDGLLTIEHQKNNLGPLQEPLRLMWPKDGLPQIASETHLAEQRKAQLEEDKAAIITLLRLIDNYATRGDYTNASPQSPYHPLKKFKDEQDFIAMNLERKDVYRIIEQCQRMGWVQLVQYTTKDRKTRHRLDVTSNGKELINESVLDLV